MGELPRSAGAACRSGCRAAVTQEAKPNLWCAARVRPRASPNRCGRGRRRHGVAGTQNDGRGRAAVEEGHAWLGGGPGGAGRRRWKGLQYSSRGCPWATLMRHRLRWRGRFRAGQRSLAFAPAAGSRGMVEAPGAAALVALRRVTLALTSRGRSAAAGAIDLAAVTVAAHQHRHAATPAQEAARNWLRHGHPGRLPRACWTGSSTGATLMPHPLLHDTV
jgi:hypothetical protein